VPKHFPAQHTVLVHLSLVETRFKAVPITELKMFKLRTRQFLLLLLVVLALVSLVSAQRKRHATAVDWALLVTLPFFFRRVGPPMGRMGWMGWSPMGRIWWMGMETPVGR